MIYIFNDLLTSSSSSRNVGSGDGCERKDRTGQDRTRQEFLCAIVDVKHPCQFREAMNFNDLQIN